MASDSTRTARSNATEAIQSYLRRFTWELNRFRTVKGLLLAGLTLLLGVYSLLVLDSLHPLPPWARWGLTSFLYLIALVLLWQGGLRHWMWRGATLKTARLVEHLHPHFQERLIASVELSLPRTSPPYHSLQFETAIHQQAARELRQVDRSQLIGWKSLAQPSIALALLALVLGTLPFIPNMQFGKRILRVAIPFVDIPPPSHWELTIVEPSEISTMVPEDQILEVRVRIRSLRNQQTNPESSYLEWVETDAIAADVAVSAKNSPEQLSSMLSSQRIPLERDSSQPELFVAKAPIGSNQVRFRAVAEESSSPWKTFVPIKRPSFTRYDLTITPPPYTGASPYALMTTSTGEVRVLAGSKIDIVATSNQTLDSASLQLERENSGQQETIGMRPLEDQNRWGAELVADGTMRFRPHLLSKVSFQGTSLRNTLNVWNRIVVSSDPLPEILWNVTETSLWEEPPLDGQTFTIGLDAPVQLPFEIRDNLPTERTELELKVNEGEWQTLSVDEASGRPHPSWPRLTALQGDQELPHTASVHWQLSSHNSGIRHGDLVAVRIKTVDRLEQSAYSTTIQLAIVQSGIQKGDYRAWHRWLAMGTPILELKRVAETPPDAWGTKLQKEAITISELIASQIQHSTDLQEEADREGIYNGLIYLVHGPLAELQVLLGQSPEDSAASDSSDRISQRVAQVQSMVQQIEESTRWFAAQELWSAFTEDLDSFIGYQRGLLAQLDRKESQEEWKRSLTIPDQLVSGMLKEPNRGISFLPQEVVQRFDEFHAWMERLRDGTRNAIDPTTGPFEARVALESLQSETQSLESRRWLPDLDRNLNPQATRLRRRFSTSLLPLTHRHMASVVRGMRTNDSLEGELAFQIEGIVQQLNSQRTIHRLRKNQDANHTADLGMTIRAWNHLVKRWQEEPEHRHELTESLASVVRAHEVLTVAHKMTTPQSGLLDLIQKERYESQTIQGVVRHPSLWQTTADQTRDFVKRVRESIAFDKPLTQKATLFAEGERFRQIDTAMANRSASREKSYSSVGGELEMWLGEWEELNLLFAPTFEEARRILQEESPTIEELARDTADSIRTLQRVTEQARDSSKQEGTPQEQLDAIELQQGLVNQGAEELQNALSELAALQNLTDPQQRQLAKDSDQALDLLDQLFGDLNDSLFEAVNVPLGAKKETEQLERFDEAISRQASAAKGLESIANHFLDQDRDGEKNRKDRSNIVSNSKEAKDREALYSRAERLEKLHESEAEKLMNQLEAELPKNPSMQRELSSIAHQTAINAANELKRAGEREHEIGVEIENGDPRFLEGKTRALEQARFLANVADRIAGQFLDKSDQLAMRITDGLPMRDSLRTQLRNARREIAERSRALQSESVDDNADKLFKKVRALSETLSHSQATIGSITNTFESNVRISSEKSDAIRRGKVAEAERAQSSIRNELRSLGRGMRQALEVERKKSEPHAQGLKQEQVETLTEILQDLDSREKRSLKEPNPYAALVAEQLRGGLTLIEDLQRRTEKLIDETNRLEPPSLQPSQLQNGMAEQRRTNKLVEQVEEELLRSARHEARLGNNSSTEELSQHADAVRSIRKSEMEEATQRLEEGKESVRNSLQKAKNALQTRSELLSGSTNEAATKERAPREEDSRTPSPEAELRGREMARILDRLDQASRGSLHPGETGDQDDSLQQDRGQVDPNSDSNAIRDTKGNMASALESAVEGMRKSLSSELQQQRENQMKKSPLGQTYLRDQRAALHTEELPYLESISDAPNDYFLPAGSGAKAREWGKLRTQRAEQVLEGTRETFDPEYDSTIRAYYEAIGK